MKIRPNQNYFLITNPEVKLDKTQVYDAVPATDLPNWEAKELVRAGGLILSNSPYHMYVVVEP